VLRDSLLTGFRLWGVRRVQRRTIVGGGAVLLVLGAIGLWNWRLVAVILGAIAMAAAVLVHHGRAPEETMEPAGEGWAFGGERIAFRLVSQVLDRKPREIAERLAARYRPGQLVELVLWVVATDRTGQPWTLVQDRFGDDVPSVTASAVGLVPGACDPYLEAQRLSLAETGLALADVLVVGWGTDTSLDARRDAIIVIGQTSMGIEQLGSHEYEGGPRRSHLVELHPDSVARSLASVDARRWQAAAVRGLVQGLDVLYPGSGPLVEELVAEPWRNRRMFSRLGRLTDGTKDRDEVVVSPVVLKVIDGGLTEEREVRTPIAVDRALSWEATSRAVPTRYR
jgi:hypothetical protein